ncbi:MAG TPA: DUF6644 family protein [Bryobacteraceae bacterium]|nr:DUF6644 family protein [Bryobacteraceae bacterium]
MTIAEISHTIQNSAFFTAIRQSRLFYPTVMATHLTCIAIFGGMILMTNLRLMGLALRSTPLASVIDSTRNWKRGGFVLMVSCGILLAGSRIDTYYANPFFLLKLTLLTSIGLHGLVFRRSVYYGAAEIDRLPKLPLRAKLAGALSLALWLGVVTCGRWIAYYDAPEKASAFDADRGHEAPVSARNFGDDAQAGVFRQ